MTIRVLCASDIHIGRRSSRVSRIYRSVDAWNEIVQQAIDRKVDLLALGGDVIDQENKSYEALGPLRNGLRRLEEAGIETVAVSGNHDWDVLHSLGASGDFDHFHLLGRDATWERFTLHRNDAPVLHIDGWSFPDEHVSAEPLASYPYTQPDDVPTMMVVHGDVGVSNSRYAPIRLNSLWSLPPVFTLLGHIHAPMQYPGPGGKIALYAGSPYPLDPGEPGPHGIWLVEMGTTGSPSINQLVIAPVRYERVEIDLSEVQTEEEFRSRFAQQIEQIGLRYRRDTPSIDGDTLSLRLEYIGISPVAAEMEKWAQSAMDGFERYPVNGGAIEIDTYTYDVRQTIDLHSHIAGNDPLAELARLILALEDSATLPTSYAALVDAMESRVEAVDRHESYRILTAGTDENAEVSMDECRKLLHQYAWDAVNELVNHRGAI